MSKIRILALACLANLAFAGGDLWDFPNMLSTENCGSYCGQVHTPGLKFCWSEVTPSAANEWGKVCYKSTGGYWFGYVDEGGDVKDAVSNRNLFWPKDAAECAGGNDATPPDQFYSVVIERYVEPGKQNVDWIPKTVAGSVSKAGHFMIKGYGLGDGTAEGSGGLDVKFSNPGGTDEKPNVSAIGFNWRGKKECGYDDYETAYIENIKAQGAGLCIVYKADKAGVDVELGWNESLYEYNTWIAKLPAASSWKTLNIKWESFGLSYETDQPTEPRETAITKAEALKFALKTKTSTPETVHFQLKELGWHGTCSGTAEELQPAQPNPIIGGKVISAYGFNVKGRTLSANFAGSVQVVSLQGKVVAQKTLAANESMNLSNLPVGVYMVRSETRGIVQKIMLK